MTAYGAFVTPYSFAVGTQVTLAMRPENVVVTPKAPSAENQARFIYRDHAYLGGMHQLSFVTQGEDRVLAVVHEALASDLAPGQEVWIVFPKDRLIVLPNAA